MSTADADGVRIGLVKTKAISNVLSYCTPKAFKEMQTHLAWAGNYNYSALSDALLSSKSLWPGSFPAEMPTEAEDHAARAGLAAAQKTKPEQFSAFPVNHRQVLTEDQFNLLLGKLILVFEGEALHLENMKARKQYQPTLDTAKVARMVVQQWDQCIRLCAEKDLNPAQLKELTATVLETNLLDEHIANSLANYPAIWHLGMLPDYGIPGPLGVHAFQAVFHRFEQSILHVLSTPHMHFLCVRV